MKDEAVAQALEGARVLELTGQVEMKMSRQMGWDGVGKAGVEEMSGWGGRHATGEAGMEEMRGWRGRRATGVCTGLGRVLFCHRPLNQSPRVTHQPCSTNTRREEEKTARGGPDRRQSP